MMRWKSFTRSILGVALVVGVASEASAQVAGPRTRPERTNFTETSSHADVVAFVDSLRVLGAPVTVLQLGTTTNGRALPLVVASRPQVRTPAEARRLNRPIVYVQGNIHGGEVEGKDAILALLRDFSFGKRPNVLDSLVLIVVPIYNADGNDSLGPQARNRGSQNGPAMIGLRPNSQGLNLNRDYIKAEAPETRASLAAFNEWNPDVFIDLHTTNGSYHGYALTYSPSLHPAAPLALYTSDTLLPEIRRRVKERYNLETFPYGNFTSDRGDAITSTSKSGWQTYEHLQRYGTNYYGLRGKISILVETYSHDPFERRIETNVAFLGEALSLFAARQRELRSRIAAGVAATTFTNARRVEVPITAKFSSRPDTQEVLVEVIERAADSTAVTEPGMRRGFRRTGKFVASRMPVIDRFEPVLTQTPPHGYIIESPSDTVLSLLQLHGINAVRIEEPIRASLQVFVVDSVHMPARAFEGHREASVTGSWKELTRVINAGGYLVRMGTPLDLLAMQLLEPQGDDGLLTWNFFDDSLEKGSEAPVSRLTAPIRLTSPGRPAPAR